MADSSSRSYRRDVPAHENQPAQRDGLSDPLAELARLIGQRSEQGGGQPPESYQDDTAPASEFDWASVNEGEGYAAGRPANGYDRSQEADPWPLDQNYESEPAAPRRGLPPASSFNGARAEPAQHARSYTPRDEQPPQSPAQPFPFIPPAQDDGYHAHNADQRGDYADDDDYDEEPAPRRSGTVVIVALLGLAVLGTAGALGYRAMFGGSMIPSLPPIIRPADGPIRVKPSHDAQNTAPGQADMGKSMGDQVVINQEQPVDIQSGNPIPRMIKTIPVVPNGPPDPGAGAQPGAVAQAPVPPPGYAEPVAPSAPAFGAPVQQPPPRQVRSPPPPAQVSRPKPPVRTAAPETPSSGGPLQLVPGREAAQPPAPRAVHTATNSPAAVPSAAAAAAPAGTGYEVQVSSQRSEADAQSAYRALQAKFPQQLGGRHVVFRRADLGDKGTYYRALVGPFASSEQASAFCSSLKAAGGSCFTQRN